MGNYRFPVEMKEGSVISEQWNEEEKWHKIVMEWNATVAVTLLPLFNPEDPEYRLEVAGHYLINLMDGYTVHLWFCCK